MKEKILLPLTSLPEGLEAIFCMILILTVYDIEI